jgi:hypothetical protein
MKRYVNFDTGARGIPLIRASLLHVLYLLHVLMIVRNVKPKYGQAKTSDMGDPPAQGSR